MYYPMLLVVALLVPAPAVAHDSGHANMGLLAGIGHMLLEHTAVGPILIVLIGLVIIERWRARCARTLNPSDSADERHRQAGNNPAGR